MKYRVLVIGTGSIGERHVRCMLATGRAEVGIAEIDDSLRGRIAERYPLVSAHASLDDALGECWQAGVVAAPAHVHVPLGLRLAEAGVPILMEKPLSTSMDGVDELLEKVQSAGLVAAMGYAWRAYPSLAAMRAALVEGKFGGPVELTVVAGQHFPLYRPAYREIYYTSRATGGGAIQDALTHMFNIGEWLVGPIDRIAVDAEHKVLAGVEVEDTVHALTRHGPVMGCYSLNQHQAPNEVTVTVVCRRGTARLEVHEQRWRWMTEPGGTWRDEPFALADRDDWFTRQEAAFLDVLEGRAEPLCTLNEGAQTLKVNLAALASADDGGAWKTV